MQLGSTRTAEPQPAPACLHLRGELKVSLYANDGQPYYLIEDPLSGQYYRLGVVEWHFVSCLDGSTTVPDAISATNRKYGPGALSDENARNICQWLLQYKLVLGLRSHHAVPATPAAVAPGNPFMSAFFVRVPICHPDALIQRLLPYCAWCFTWYAFAGWLLLTAYGTVIVFANWGKFCQSAAAYWSPSTWLQLYVVWLLLKIVHECFHGLACRRFGGHVGVAGVAFILFSPVAFVDVTSAWRFRSKWHRIVTSSAGMYVEFAIAAVACVVWQYTTSAAVEHLCHSIIVAASLSTLLFNANPLMRFDGYYILADLLEIQNLYTSASQRARAFVGTVFLGWDSPQRTMASDRKRLLLAYGLASMLWRTSVSLSLTIVAARLFHGAGLVLAIAGALCWFALPFIKFVRFAMFGDGINATQRKRLAISLAVTAATLATIALIPVPGGVRAPAIVEYAPLHTVRTASDAFVDCVHVVPGELVEQNQILVSMHSEEIQTEYESVKLAIEQSKIKARILHRDDNVATYQAELMQLEAMQKRLASLQKEVDGLIVRAPAAGQVLTSRLSQLEGQHVDIGTPLLKIGAEANKEVHVSIPEHFIEHFLRRVGGSPQVRVSGAARRVRGVRLTSVEPRASDQLPSLALAAAYGGPLPVRPVAADKNSASGDYLLTAPRFQGVVQLEPNSAEKLRAGQLADVSFTDVVETVGSKVLRFAAKWIYVRWSPVNAA